MKELKHKNYRGRPKHLNLLKNCSVTRSGVEVDFIVYGPPGLWALEVKNTATIRLADLRGLKSFRDEYPELLFAKCADSFDEFV